MAKSEKHWIMTVSHININQISDKEYKEKQPDKQPIKQWKYKYDYAALKQEFMQSEIEDTREFIRQRLGKDTAKNKQLATKTKWWTKEKQRYKQKLAEKAIAKSLEKQANQLSAKIPLDRLVRMKSDFFDLIDQAIDTMMSQKNVEIDKVIKWLNAIKTELWEPTTVAKNENENRERIEAINIVIWPQDLQKK